MGDRGTLWPVFRVARPKPSIVLLYVVADECLTHLWPAQLRGFSSSHFLYTFYTDLLRSLMPWEFLINVRHFQSSFAAGAPCSVYFCEMIMMLRIHDILARIRMWIRICGSMSLTNGSGSFYFHWPSRCQLKTNLKKVSLQITFWRHFYIIFKR